MLAAEAEALVPERPSKLHQTSMKEKAVGMPALLSSLEQLLKYMSPADAWKAAFALNQKGGFDCPGCAWPDPDDDRASLGEYCENGVKAIAEEAQHKKITAKFFSQHSIGEMASWTDFELGKKGRLAEPMLLNKASSHYEPVSWEDAFQLIAGELNSLATPDEAVFYTSGRTSNEAAFLYQLFVRMYGTNNLPDCSNMCHESSGRGLNETIGIGKGTVSLEDIHQAELILIIGQNPGTNHPRMLTALEKCKERGGKIIAINPLPEPGLMYFINPQSPGKMLRGGTALADLFLQVRINGDVGLLKGLMKGLIEADALDHEFINAKTEGFAEFVEALQASIWSDIVANSGVSKREIENAVEILCKSKATITCWAMGLTQHKNAVATIQELVNLALLQGNIGKAGAGLCPVRGHSNVQGDRTVGIWEKPAPAFLDALQREFNFEPPREHGFDTVAAIKAMHDGLAKVFFALGGNFLSATPDTEFTAAALRRCRLTAHVATKLNRSHLITGEQALILPCLGRTEMDVQASGAQFVSTENSMGVVQSSQGVNPAASDHLLSEPMIVAKLAEATLCNHSATNWSQLVANYDHLRAAIERTIPGFENYNVRVRQPGGFYLPNGPREGRFPTPSGKAIFTVHSLPPYELQDGDLVMMTIRSHDQFNTTIYGLDDRYRGIFNERRVVLMNARDIDELGFNTGEVVDLVGVYNGETRTARRFIIVAYDIPRRCCATYFPEANVLVPITSVAEKSNTPVSKYVVIRLQKSTSV